MSASTDKASLAVLGLDALRAGDSMKARELLTRAVESGQNAPQNWLALAVACRALRDTTGTTTAVNRVLALEPHNFQAQIIKADLYSEAADARSASAHYAAAVRNAGPIQQLAPYLQSEVQRAQLMSERYARDYEGFLRTQLAARGFDPAVSSGRFAQSIDLCVGRKQVYLQQPTQYYFPELPQIQFYDRKTFPWLDAVESATDDIATELRAVMQDSSAFRPYVESIPNRPRPKDDSMIDNPDWSAFFLWKNGTLVRENAARCPKTLRALEHVPQCRIVNRTPSILFSQLRAGTRISSHAGCINTRLICHLPLIVPENCGFRVGNDTREWKKGKAWAFDDTIEHEAWNTSLQTRVILIFEVWRPELSQEEQLLVAGLLESIDKFGGEQIPWSN